MKDIVKYFLIGFAATVLALFAAGAFATGNQNHECQGGHNCNTSGGATANAASSSTAVGVGVGIGVGKGGSASATGGNAVGGNATGGNASANPTATADATGAPVTVTSKSLSIGGGGLAASANACQGSFNVGPIGKTYDIDFCRTLAIRDGMAGAGFTEKSQQAVMCKGIADLKDLPECQQ